MRQTLKAYLYRQLVLLEKDRHSKEACILSLKQTCEERLALSMQLKQACEERLAMLLQLKRENSEARFLAIASQRIESPNEETIIGRFRDPKDSPSLALVAETINLRAECPIPDRKANIQGNALSTVEILLVLWTIACAETWQSINKPPRRRVIIGSKSRWKQKQQKITDYTNFNRFAAKITMARRMAPCRHR